MIDEELFELCKEVFTKTQWGQYGDEGLSYFNEELNVARKDMPPLYTSDYLLEKLQARVYAIRMFVLSDEFMEGRHDSPAYQCGYRKPYGDFQRAGEADTPLKALLKLTIALHDGGELK